MTVAGVRPRRRSYRSQPAKCDLIRVIYERSRYAACKRVPSAMLCCVFTQADYRSSHETQDWRVPRKRNYVRQFRPTAKAETCGHSSISATPSAGKPQVQLGRSNEVRANGLDAGVERRR